MAPDIETGENSADAAVREFHDPSDMRRCIDRDFRPILRLTGHFAFGKSRLHRGGHAQDWPHHGDERREIIGAYIKHGAGAWLIEEIWVWMPIFHPVIQPECCSGNRPSDLPIINQLDAGLKTAAKKRIGSITNTYLFSSRGLENGLAISSPGRQRFFVVDGFACRNGLQGDFSMCVGNREIDNDLDFWISQQFLYRACFGNTVMSRLATCSFHIDVRTSNDLQNVKEAGRFKINTADITTTDDANGGFIVHKRVNGFLLCVPGIQLDALTFLYILWHNERPCLCVCYIEGEGRKTNEAIELNRERTS